MILRRCISRHEYSIEVYCVMEWHRLLRDAPNKIIIIKVLEIESLIKTG